MSRCFPFPPPGYEKKIRSDEVDPLIKEKCKEKKHKKEKDKEKEGKEKRSKDRSKHKHKERKEKKEKRKDWKYKPLEEKKAEVLTNSGNGEKLVTNTVQNHSNGESKHVQDLASRFRYEEEATGSQSAQKINYPHQNSLGITGKACDKTSFWPIQETNHREYDDEKFNTQKNFALANFSENAVARVSFGADQKRAEAMGKPMERRDQTRPQESPVKSHRKESVTNSDKSRDKEGLKKIEAKDKDRNTEKKEERTMSINKIRQEKPKLIGGPKLEEKEKVSLDIRNCKPPDLSRANGKNHISEGNLGKRKDHETNGFLYENGTTPYKLQRHSASESSKENGRTLGAHQTPSMPAFEVHETACKPEVKEVRINGFVVSGVKQKVCPPNPLAATMKAKVKENGEASVKPPHPDLKYLNQILNVPKLEMLQEVDDDEEWLFGQSSVKLKNARRDSLDSGESLQVWNRAFRIEYADIAALPYVVPF